MEDKDKLGTFFQKAFEGQRLEMENEEIEMMIDIISKKAFYRFSFYYFNIFYSAAILIALLVALTTSGYYIYKNQSESSSIAKHTEKVGNLKTLNSAGTPIVKSLVHSDSVVVIKSEKVSANFDSKQMNNVHNKIEFKDNVTTKISAGVDILSNGDKKSVIENEISRDLEKDSMRLISENKIVTNIVVASDQIPMAKPTVKKTIVIVKKDTIYNIDTVTSKPRRYRIK